MLIFIAALHTFTLCSVFPSSLTYYLSLNCLAFRFQRKSTTPKRGAARRASPAKRASARSTPSKKTAAKRSPAKKVAEAPAPEKKTPRKPPTERGPPPPRSTQRKRKRAAESEEGPDGGKTPAKKNKVEEEATVSRAGSEVEALMWCCLFRVVWIRDDGSRFLWRCYARFPFIHICFIHISLCPR